MGNPHWVLFDGDHDVESIDRLGSLANQAIPGGVNVEFVRSSSKSCDSKNGTAQAEFNTVVFERGVGRTFACGTGAAAVAAAAVHSGRAKRNEAIIVNLPGGPLSFVVDDENRVQMTGPARLVYSAMMPFEPKLP